MENTNPDGTPKWLTWRIRWRRIILGWPFVGGWKAKIKYYLFWYWRLEKWKK